MTQNPTQGDEMTTSTNLKPGDAVRHPEKGNGVYVIAVARRVPQIFYATTGGFPMNTVDLTDWERVETLPVGHVAVRVDDLDLNHPEGVRALWMRVQRLATDPTSHETYEEWAAANNSRCNEVLKPGHVQVKVDDLHLSRLPTDEEICDSAADRVAIRAARAVAAQTSPGVELPVKLSHPEPTERGAKATFTFYDGREALRLLRVWEEDGLSWQYVNGSLVVWDELTRMDGVEGSLTLGWGDEEAETREVAEEPRELGAWVTVTQQNGVREKWYRADDTSFPWEDGSGGARTFADLCKRGVVTLGYSA